MTKNSTTTIAAVRLTQVRPVAQLDEHRDQQGRPNE